ncbi:MAG: hypothetical protein RXO24_12310 [Acidilobus sp.]
MPLRAPKPTDVVVQVYLRKGRLKGIRRLRDIRKRCKGPLTRAGRGRELTLARGSYAKDGYKSLVIKFLFVISRY